MNNKVQTPEQGASSASETSGVGARGSLAGLLGPAFVAAIAYVDPGNVAANLSAGATYGYLLLWVLVASNVMAMVVQYLSAKYGLVAGQSLTAGVAASFERRGARSERARRRNRAGRLLYWGQAEIVAAATDIAEIIGGATALHLLFGTPMLLGGMIVGVVSLGLLLFQGGRSQRTFEGIIVAFLVVITVGFLAGLFVTGLSVGEMAAGIIPRFDGTHTVVLAASMLGATVMPHAVYLHSGLVRDRNFDVRGDESIRRHLRATRLDVFGALVLAGTVNIGMLCLAAEALPGIPGTDSIEGAHAAVDSALGPVVGVLFAVGLLASGLASSSVGCYAGDMIMRDLLRIRVPLLVRRAITIIPALVVIATGVEPTWALVLSQVVLSIGIPFALVPLVRMTSSGAEMGKWTNTPIVRRVAWGICALIIALNVALIVLIATGQA